VNDARLRDAYAAWLAQRVPTGRDACGSPEALLALAQKQGDEAGRLATLDHAMSCAACRQDLELLRSLAAAGGMEPGARRAPFWSAPSFRLAASIAFVAAVGATAGVFLLQRNEPVHRGGPASVTTVSPGGDVRPGEADRLVWRPVTDATGYFVEVLSADGAAVLSASTRDTFVVVPAGALTVGREYRWTLRATLGDGTQAAAEPRRFRVMP
jgi:hypothetical protein